MASPVNQLEDLRRLAKRYGMELDILDRLSLRPREVARTTGFSLRTVEGWVSRGELPVIEVPGGIAIALADLLRFLESGRRRRGSVRPVGRLADRARSLIDHSGRRVG